MSESRSASASTEVFWLEPVSRRDVRNSLDDVVHGIFIPLSSPKAIRVELCSRIVEKRGCSLEKCR